MKKYFIMTGIFLFVGIFFLYIYFNLESSFKVYESEIKDFKTSNQVQDEVILEDNDVSLKDNKESSLNTKVENNSLEYNSEESNISSNDVVVDKNILLEESSVEVLEVDNNLFNDDTNSSSFVIDIDSSLVSQEVVNNVSTVVEEEYFTINVLDNDNNLIVDKNVDNVSNNNNQVVVDTSNVKSNEESVNDKTDTKVEVKNDKVDTENLEDEKIVQTSKSIKLNKEVKYLKYKNTYQLKATIKGIDGTVVWSTSNKKIANVDQNGKVTATGGGVAIITATVGNEKATCKIIAVRNTFQKLDKNPYRTKASIYYNGDEKITYYFRTQSYNTACSSEKVNGKEICTSGFRQWYAGHGCGTTSVTAVVNAYLGNTKNNLISEAKMRMYYEKNEYNWKCNSDDPYCNRSVFQFTRKRVADVLNNQFNLDAKAYVIKSKTGNEKHIERITNALAEGRPVIIFINATQAGTTKFTSQNHTLVMVGFADEKGNVLVLDSSHDGFREDTVSEMVNQYIGRGNGNYRGYIVLNKNKSL